MRLIRHRLVDRIFHWVMAASVLALLLTGFLPILGLKFPWVTPHWIAGLVLLAVVLFHIVRASIWQGLKAMGIDGLDLRNAWRAVRWTLRRASAEPGKPGKYSLLQKLFHHVAAATLLVTLVTGLLMMVKVDTPFWTRNPYWLADHTWGLIYVLHGLAAMAVVTLIMVHVYFALRPEKLWYTRSMMVGWMSREDYLANHDPQRWNATARARNPSADTSNSRVSAKP